MQLHYKLSDGKQLVLAGCFSGEGEDEPIVITKDNFSSPATSLTSNAEESDVRIWRHIKQSTATRTLIYSPDTDVHNIGIYIALGLLANREIIVQINQSLYNDKYVSLNNLSHALRNDPDLAPVNIECIEKIMQTIYIVTGCDYISFFKFIGKKSFLDTYFQHARFISGSQMPGCLSQTCPEVNELEHGFLAFIRLIGTVYFKQHVSTFSSRHACKTPEQLFNSIY